MNNATIAAAIAALTFGAPIAFVTLANAEPREFDGNVYIAHNGEPLFQFVVVARDGNVSIADRAITLNDCADRFVDARDGMLSHNGVPYFAIDASDGWPACVPNDIDF